MIRTVLVTGGAGFIGAYVTRRLIAQGYRVVVYDALPSANVLSMLVPPVDPDGVRIEAGAISDGPRLRRVCAEFQIDAIVHLASPLTQDVTAHPEEGIRDICGGTAALFAAAKDLGIARIVWTSSVAVFGAKGNYPPGPLANDACHRPSTLYGSCKSLCEILAKRAFEVDRLDTVGLRLSVVYGAGRLRGYMSYPSHMIRSAATGDRIEIPWGRQSLHWQYVEEVADIVAMLLASDRPGAGETYNAPGDRRTWAEFAKILKRARPGLDVIVGDGIDPVLSDVVEDYDPSALTTDFGYEMRWPLERAVPDALETYVSMTNSGSDRSRGT